MAKAKELLVLVKNAYLLSHHEPRQAESGSKQIVVDLQCMNPIGLQSFRAYFKVEEK